MKLGLTVLVLCFAVPAWTQTVTVSETDASLKKIFRAIDKQTDYSIVYNDEMLKNSKPVTIDVKDAKVSEVLAICFKDQPIEYVIEEMTIIIREKPKPADLPKKKPEPLQPLSVQGQVRDPKGEPMPGVSILIKGTNTGTTSDAGGKYSIILPEGEGWGGAEVLVFTFIGYKKVEESVSSRTLINLTMEEEVIGLDEVVINAGYYNVTDREKTGSISRVTSKEIERQPVTNPLQALQGRVPGIYIDQFSGVPGSSFEVRIRGTNSISNGNNPLYIIDGVPFGSETLSDPNVSVNLYGSGGISPLNSVNPNDIESIEILKDADATAIYGSRGANGVVLITTKRGKAGAIKVDINVKSGVSKVMRRVDLLSTKQYLAMRMEAVSNDGTAIRPDEYDINGTWDMNRYTDWQDVLIGGTAQMTDVNASVSGGSNDTQFLFSAGYNNQGTVFPGTDVAGRLTTHFSVVHAPADKKFNTRLSSSYAVNTSNIVALDLTERAINLAPNAPTLHEEDGDLNWENLTWYNPLAYLNERFNLNTYNLITNVELGYRVIKGLQIKASIGLNDMRNEERRKTPSTANPPLSSSSPADSKLMIGDQTIRSWIIEPQVSYERQIGKGRFTALLGGTYQNRNNEGSREIFEGFPSNALINDPKSAASVQLDYYNYSEYRYVAMFGRLNYNWDEKYIVNITGRRDGSSRFGPGKKFANLGAIGFAWVFSNEGFIKNSLSFLSFGKLRGSYGLTGNDQIGDYQYLDLYAAGAQYQGTTSLGPAGLYNPEYGWEVNKKLEGALELGFFRDRIFLEAAWYRNRSSNQLIRYNLGSTTGYGYVLQNSPATVQNTGVEFELHTINISNNLLTWTTDFNISVPRNKLIEFPNLASSSYATKYIIGKPLNIFKGFHYLGVDPVTGIYRFDDVNGDGNLTPADFSSAIELGQIYYGGFNNSLSFKGIQLDISFQFVRQKGFSFDSYGAPGSIFAGNQPASVFKGRWQNPGDQATGQLFSRGFDANYARDKYSASDARASVISFIRLKNISISYQVPAKLLSGIRIRIYVQGQNLWTVSNYAGIDPETGSSNLPPLTTFVGGLQLTF